MTIDKIPDGSSYVPSNVLDQYNAILSKHSDVSDNNLHIDPSRRKDGPPGSQPPPSIPPSDPQSNANLQQTQHIIGLLNEPNSLVEMTDELAKVYKTMLDVREEQDKARQTAGKAQVQFQHNEADDDREAAKKQETAGIVQHSVEVGSGLVEGGMTAAAADASRVVPEEPVTPEEPELEFNSKIANKPLSDDDFDAAADNPNPLFGRNVPEDVPPPPPPPPEPSSYSELPSNQPQSSNPPPGMGRMPPAGDNADIPPPPNSPPPGDEAIEMNTTASSQDADIELADESNNSNGLKAFFKALRVKGGASDMKVQTMLQAGASAGKVIDGTGGVVGDVYAAQAGASQADGKDDAADATQAGVALSTAQDYSSSLSSDLSGVLSMLDTAVQQWVKAHSTV